MKLLTKQYKLPPNNIPLKTTTLESYLKAMISMDCKGFGLYSLV